MNNRAMPFDPNAPFGRELTPMIEDAYAPVAAEQVFENMTVIGEIPADLNGVYLRNGPNQRYQPNGRYHWFDGDAMLHAAHFDRGRVTYRNRWLRSAGFIANERAGRELYHGVIESHRHRTDRPMRDTPNTDVIGHGGAAVASWYLSGAPYRVHPVTLETLGPADYAQGLHGAFASHPKVDEHTGEMMFFDYWNESPYMSYGVVDAGGRLTHQVPIELPGPRLPHDLAITQHYTILHDLPLFYDLDALAAGRHKVAFYPEMPARFGVIPRHGQAHEIRWFEASPCFIYHVVNAYEEGDEVVMIGCRYLPPRDASGRIDAAKMAKMIALLAMDARLYRWRFNLRTGATREEPIDPDRNVEFPTINNSLTGRRSRFVYLALQTLERPHFPGLVRYDVDSGVAQVWQGDPEDYYSEAPFAPADAARSEDDGYVVSFVWCAAEQRSELQVFDARALQRGPIARVLVPARIPAGFHATWMQPRHIAGYAA
jgi:carotenoid cleavage dioxygenase-like enzyme